MINKFVGLGWCWIYFYGLYTVMNTSLRKQQFMPMQEDKTASFSIAQKNRCANWSLIAQLHAKITHKMYNTLPNVIAYVELRE